MYTQCPECSAAFRVTANDLKQAAGKVRCGGCGSAFDALEFLSEEMPQQPPTKESARQLPELKPAHRAGDLPEQISPEESIALLKTLDELAGSDIRVEDTGIEWRVLDDQVIAELETADALVDEAGAENESEYEPASDSGEADNDQSANDADEGGDDEPPSDEPRYDDDTPMPEDSDEDDSAEANDENKSGDEAPEEAAPVDQAPAEDAPDEESEPQSDELDVAFDDDETGDWEEILDEFDEPDTMAPADDTSDEDVRGPVDEDAGEGIDAEDNDEPEEGGVDEDESRDDETDNVDEDESHDDEIDDLDADEGRDNDETADLREDERHDDEIDDVGEDQDSGGEDVDERLPEVQEEPFEVESIIMEGETVRNALDELAEDEPATDADISYWVPPEDNVAPARSPAASFGRTLGVVLLLLVLGLQVVHYYRDTLATVPAIQKIIVPVYRTIGMPLSPDWDVTAWRFEATQGNSDSDNNELIVFSRIGNTSNTSLPYPLIGISLTDRFDETVGSRLLEPQEFLSDGTNPRKLVPAGATFDAVISIAAPNTQATGYKLNVCYRSTGGASAGRLRCAIGDFKE